MTVTSGKSWAAMKDSMTGCMVLVSALFPSNADTISGTVLAGEQADGDLWLQPPLFGEPGLAAAGRRHPDHAHQRSARRVILTLLTLGGGTVAA